MELEVVDSLGNVEVESDSDFSEVVSRDFVTVVEGVVGRVMSGGHGRSLVLLPIVGRV